MARMIHRLSARGVKAISAPGRHADGGGLYLSISRPRRKASNRPPINGRRWVFLYRWGKKRVEMGLGPAPGPNVTAAVPLAEAREKADAARQQLRSGMNPIDARRTLKAQRAEADVQSFGEFADDFVRDVVPGFKNEKHRDQWRKTFSESGYAAPLRPLRIDSIQTSDVLDIIKPIWTDRAETASRVRQRIERVLEAAKSLKKRTGDNPADKKTILSNLPKRPKGKNFAAMAYADVPSFIKDLQSLTSVSARALEFLILTAARTGEVRGAKWNEIDGDLWTVPAERMKSGVEHEVPLCGRALAILKEMAALRRGKDGYIFPGEKRGKPLSDMALLQCLRGMRGDGVTVHGFRSAFRDWAGDKTAFPREVAEAALAHTLKDKTEAAYRRSKALDKRRDLMGDWAAFATPQAETRA